MAFSACTYSGPGCEEHWGLLQENMNVPQNLYKENTLAAVLKVVLHAYLLGEHHRQARAGLTFFVSSSPSLSPPPPPTPQAELWMLRTPWGWGPAGLERGGQTPSLGPQAAFSADSRRRCLVLQSQGAPTPLSSPLSDKMLCQVLRHGPWLQ